MKEENCNYSSGYEKKPEPPREPEPWECCQSGCDPCVYDRYWEALDRHERALQVWQMRYGGSRK
ncbi:MAG: oxidoreductase-like domain-containing protein [Pseudomonadota bacterium]